MLRRLAPQVFVGLVVRDHLMVLLRQALGRTAGGQLSYSDLNRRYVSSAAQRIITEQQMAVLQAGTVVTQLQLVMLSYPVVCCIFGHDSEANSHRTRSCYCRPTAMTIRQMTVSQQGTACWT
jgi:hypothetical protein